MYNISNTSWKRNISSSGTLAFTIEARDHYYRVLQILREVFPIVTESQHQRNIMSLVIRICQDKHNNFEKITKDWLNRLFQIKLDDYTCIGLIADYPFNQALKINNILVARIDSDEGKDLIDKYIQASEIPGILNRRLPQINSAFSCTVKAYDAESCKLISVNHVKRVLSFVKLVDCQSEIRLERENDGTKTESYCVMAGNENIGFSLHNTIRKDFMTRSYNYDQIEELKKNAEKFIFKTDLTDLERSILSALYWYGRVDITFDSDIEQYISYINGLERLVLYDTKIDKAEQFGKMLSKLYNRLDKNDMTKMYKKRNDLLHESEPDIYREDLVMLRILLSDLIIKLILENKNHVNLYSYFSNCFGF